jgi:hypothetical protein
MDGVMALLSLGEAAEQAAVSKADVWGAIRDGSLPATRTSDGGYAIDPSDLSRIFGDRRPKPEAAPPVAPPAPPARKTDDASTKPAEADDVSAAFAALQAELKNLLDSPTDAEESGDSGPQDEPEERVRPAAEAAEEVPVAKAEARAAEPAAPAPATPEAVRLPWWRRLGPKAPSG